MVQPLPPQWRAGTPGRWCSAGAGCVKRGAWLGEPHPPEDDAREQSVGATERLEDLEVVQAGGDDQLGRPAGCAKGGVELDGHAPELRALVLAVRDRHRTAKPIG